LGVLHPDINDAQGACPIAEPEVEVQTVPSISFSM